MVFLTVWLGTGAAWGNSAPLWVVFAPSGRELPQAAIRVAVGTELGREALSEAAVGEGSDGKAGASGDALSEQDNRERVVVAVDELGQLWVRYWGPRGLVDRHLAMPERPEQLPLVVSLAVGNLVRQEAFELLRDLERRRAEAKAADVEPERKPTPVVAPVATTRPRLAPVRRNPPAPERRNSWGHYWVRDYVYIPTVSRACRQSGGAPCYDSQGQSVFSEMEGAGIAGGVQGAHSRYVMAYSRAFTPDVWGTVRLGVAFSGGKVKNQAAEQDHSQPAFWPWLLELRVQYFPVRGAFNGALRPYVHATVGAAEASAEVEVQLPLGTTSEAQGPSSVRATSVHSVGLLTTGAGLGASLRLVDGLRAEAELSGFLAFPTSGVFLRPSVGLTYDF